MYGLKRSRKEMSLDHPRDGKQQKGGTLEDSEQRLERGREPRASS